MRFFLTVLFLIIFIGQTYAMNESKNCPEILNDIENTPTEDLYYYLILLQKNHIIDLKSVEYFSEQLDKGFFKNPIDHKMTLNGPLFDNSTKQLHYKQFQMYINAQISNPDYINFKLLKSKINNEVSTLNKTEIEKREISKSVNFDHIIGSLFDDYFLSMEVVKGMKKFLGLESKDTLIKISNQMINTNDARMLNLGYELLASTEESFSISYIKNILSNPQIGLGNALDFVKDDHTEAFTQFVQEYLRTEKDLFKRWIVLKKVQSFKDPQWPPLLKKMVKESVFISNERYSIHLPVLCLNILAANSDTDTIDFLKNIAYGQNSIHPDIKKEAFSKLIDLGHGEAIFDKENIQKLSKDKKYIEILSGLFASLTGKSDDQSWSVTKKALVNFHQISDQHMVQGLQERQNKEAKEYIRKLYQILPNKRQLIMKLQMLRSINDEWALDFIRQCLNHKSVDVKAYAAYALGYMKTIESRQVIEEYIYNRNLDIALPIYDAMKKRPLEDLLYFAEKYKVTLPSFFSSDEIERSIIDKLAFVNRNEMLPHLHKLLNQVGNSGFSLQGLKLLVGSFDVDSIRIFSQFARSGGYEEKKVAKAGLFLAYIYYRDIVQVNKVALTNEQQKAFNSIDLRFIAEL